MPRAPGAALWRHGLTLAAASVLILALLLPVNSVSRALLAAPSATALARLEPVDAVVELGQTTVVNMFVQDVANMYGVDIRLQFDPARVQVVDVDLYSPGFQIQPLYGFLSPDFVIKRGACNAVEPDNPDCAEAGFVWYAVTQINPSPPVTGSGKIAAITFRGLAVGSAPITMTYAKAADRSGNTILLDRLDGSITVTSDPPLTATSTSTLSATPTATFSITPTAIGTPTLTATPEASDTPTNTPTLPCTSSVTPSVTPTASQTAIVTPIPETGTVKGWVFLDIDRDGIHDAGEPGLAGVMVRVSNSATGQSVSVMTATGGSYRVASLLLDTDYWIKQFPLAGHDLTTPPLVSIRFRSAEAQRFAEVSFGNSSRSGSQLRLPILWR